MLEASFFRIRVPSPRSRLATPSTGYLSSPAFCLLPASARPSGKRRVPCTKYEPSGASFELGEQILTCIPSDFGGSLCCSCRGPCSASSLRLLQSTVLHPSSFSAGLRASFHLPVSPVWPCRLSMSLRLTTKSERCWAPVRNEAPLVINTS